MFISKTTIQRCVYDEHLTGFNYDSVEYSVDVVYAYESFTDHYKATIYG